jgi:uncharacterized protein (DUF2235 family)
VAATQGRNLVVCCDGTNNEIGRLLSNVLKLYRISEKSDRQVVYYNPGIGTVGMRRTWGRSRQDLSSLFEMATGHGLDRDALNAYCFLCRHYKAGDSIYLFGFSRGAYTVRVVAGLVYLIGLLREHQVGFADYALKAYKGAKAGDDYALARQFQRVVTPQCVPIRFLGLWDTVSSVIVPRHFPFIRFRLEELPFTSENPAVQVVRHAIAIDEFRRMFRPRLWVEGQEFRHNPFSQRQAVIAQDCRQVWFAGCHSDVGGGFVEEESGLSKYPLIWMLEQARANGLLVRTQMINHIARGQPRVGARDYAKPDPTATLHRSMNLGWGLLEVFPKSTAYQEWPARRRLAGLYLPRAEPRYIPPRSLLHTSVVERIRKIPQYAPVNVTADYLTESMSGPLPKPKPKGRRAP